MMNMIRGRRKKLAVLCMLGLALASCSTPGSKRAADGDAGGGFRLRPYEEKTLPNGLRVLYVHDESLPYISYSLLVRAGASEDPENRSGLAAIVAELLDKGTSKRSAPQIAADLGQIGAEFSAGASVDYSIVSASALATQASPLLKIFAEIVKDPTFSGPEIERARKQMLAVVERQIDHPGAFADMAWMNFLYGGHPYARPVTGTLKSLRNFRKKDIILYYLRQYRPNNSILAVTGKFTPELVAEIETSFASWEARNVPQPVFSPAPPVVGRTVMVVDKPGLVQSQIRIGHLGIRRVDEKFLPLRVANTILGGAFSSRLVNRVRKEKGLTYSISSNFDARLDVGPFDISTFTKNESTGQTLNEIFTVLAEFREKGVTKTEVEQAKGYLKGVFPGSIETAEKLAFNLMLLRFYGISDTYLTGYLKKIDDLSVSDVNEAIRQSIDPDNIKILVYSSAPDVREQVEPFGATVVKKAVDLR